MQKTKLRKYTFNIVLLFVVLLFCFAVLEITVRLISPSLFHPDILLQPHLNLVYNVNLSGVSPLIHHTTNKLGFRGDPFPKNIEEYNFILTIGGSTTLCFYLDDTKTWPTLLQKKLRESSDPSVLVQNAGLDGHSTRGHLLVMQYVVPKVKPNTIIMLVGVNDLGNSLDKRRFEEGNKFEKVPFIYKLFSYSRVLQILYSWKQTLFGEVTLTHQSNTNLVLLPLEHEDSLSEGFQKELVSLPEYEHNLKTITQMAKDMHIRLIFVTHPLLFSDDKNWSSVQATGLGLSQMSYNISAQTYAKMLNIFNKRLLDVCHETSTECIDLANLMPHENKYFYDAVHFNEAGSEFVAQTIQNYITEHEKNNTR